MCKKKKKKLAIKKKKIGDKIDGNSTEKKPNVCAVVNHIISIVGEIF